MACHEANIRQGNYFADDAPGMLNQKMEEAPVTAQLSGFFANLPLLDRLLWGYEHKSGKLQCFLVPYSEDPQEDPVSLGQIKVRTQHRQQKESIMHCTCLEK